MSENNRRHTRHDVQIDVTLTLMEDDARAMQTRDLSEGGMFLETATPSDFPMGEMVHVNYLNPLRDNDDTDVDAIIVRVSDNGIGVAFIEMDAF
ncbi:MAG: PilZ domain-containing protein [Gammaproteobacteria bacterium]|nr:PilZ domain-containing protein [Gammaproteobacteria bacterium]